MEVAPRYQLAPCVVKQHIHQKQEEIFILHFKQYVQTSSPTDCSKRLFFPRIPLESSPQTLINPNWTRIKIESLLLQVSQYIHSRMHAYTYILKARKRSHEIETRKNCYFRSFLSSSQLLPTSSQFAASSIITFSE